VGSANFVSVLKTCMQPTLVAVATRKWIMSVKI